MKKKNSKTFSIVSSGDGPTAVFVAGKIRETSNIYFFSGPCGCGKTTLSNAFAKHLIDEKQERQVYVIHGDDFHNGFLESECGDYGFTKEQNDKFMPWEEVLKFNWDCILTVARKVLDKGLDVVIDYIIEDELPLVVQLAKEYDANLYYVVLTATEECIREHITKRGDVRLIERALVLKDELDHDPGNQGHLFHNTGMSIEDEIKQLRIEDFKYKY